jgi:hypothetical protein
MPIRTIYCVDVYVTLLPRFPILYNPRFKSTMNSLNFLLPQLIYSGDELFRSQFKVWGEEEGGPSSGLSTRITTRARRTRDDDIDGCWSAYSVLDELSCPTDLSPSPRAQNGFET